MASDIEFTIGADVSDLEEKMEMADAAFKRMAAGTARYAPDPQASMSKGASDLYALEHIKQKYNEALKRLKASLRHEDSYNAAVFSEDATKYKQFLDAAKKSRLKTTYIPAENGGEEAFKYEIISDAIEKDKLANKEEIKQGEITDETKAQNREYNAQYINLTKLHKLILSILAAWRAMKGLVGAVTDKIRISNEARGALMTDADSAFSANVNKTYAMILRGIKNLGANSPFSEGAYKSAVEKLQTMRESALTGQGVDEQFTIAVQQLNRMLGTDLNAEELLTGSKNKSGVEIFNSILETVENKMGDIAKMGRVEQSQVLSYLRTVLGEGVANGVMLNANKSMITGDIRTAIQKILEAGGSESANTNLVRSTEKLSESTIQLRVAFDVFKSELVDKITPGLVTFLGALTRFTAWATSILDKLFPKMPETKEEVEQQIKDNEAKYDVNSSFVGPADYNGSVIDVGKALWHQNELAFKSSHDLAAAQKAGKKESQEMLKSLNTGQALVKANKIYSNPGSAVDLMAADVFASPKYGSGFAEENAERIKQMAAIREIASKGIYSINEYGVKLWTQFDDPFTQDLANRLRTINPDYKWSNMHDVENSFFGEDFRFKELRAKYFGEGGMYDWRMGEETIADYFSRVMSQADQLRYMLALNMDNTGERVRGTEAVQVAGGVRVILDTTSFGTKEVFVPLTRKEDFISELN